MNAEKLGLPWETFLGDSIIAMDMRVVASVMHPAGDNEVAAHIVKCVNSHDALVEALEVLTSYCSPTGFGPHNGAEYPYAQGMAALALAKGE